MSKIVEKRGKTAVGWETIIAPTIPKTVVAQIKQTTKKIKKAEKFDLNVIFSGDFILSDLASSAQIFGSEFFEMKSDRILGGESVLFSRFVSSDMLDSVLWPRLSVVADRLWSSTDSSVDKNLSFFYKRQSVFSDLLDFAGVEHLSGKFFKISQFVNKYFSKLDDSMKKQISEHIYVVSFALSPTQRSKQLGDFSNKDLDEFIDILEPESETTIYFTLLVDSMLKQNANTAWWNKSMPQIDWMKIILL